MTVYCLVRDTPCCGLYLLHNFHTFIPTSPQEYKSIRSRLMGYGKYALYATTADYQEDIAEALRQAKFVETGSWINPNTGSRVTMWFRTPGSSRRPKT